MGEKLVILHFNDVYNVESRASPEPVGGAARFCTAIKSFRHLNPLVLFSGDVFSPSILSTFTKGEQMVPVLNEVGTQCAVFGNHDFDYGLKVLSQWVSKCNFPWLMSNVVDNETGRPLGEGLISFVVHWAGHQIGIVGLAEKEWLNTLDTIKPEETTFIDFCEAGQKLSSQLKKEGCDYVIALTHMRTPNDKKLAENCDDIDLLLGGHDHVYEINRVNEKYIIKSGTDFRQFSKIVVDFQNGSKKAPEVTIEEVNITSGFIEDTRLKGILDEYTNIIESKMDDVLGYFAVPLDGLFKTVRTSESNLGNWVCDVVLGATGADLVILNSGGFRSDQVHPAGDFTMRDLTNIMPMPQPTVVLKVTGNQILTALENSVSMYPKLEGRFPQVSGISFAFDPNLPVGKRVDPTLIRIGDKYLQLDQAYRLATKSYLHTGRDGYTVFENAEVLVAEDECPEIAMAIQNYFQAINMRLGKTKTPSKHLSRRHSLVKMFDVNELTMPSPSSAVETNTDSIQNLTTKITRRASFDDLEQESCQLIPTVNHRIVIINNEEKRQELIHLRKQIEENATIEADLLQMNGSALES